MDQASGHPAFGTLLRRWRRLRGLSQLQLSLEAEVSARHLSWLESGKAGPSRAMALRLAEQLQMPLRERNTLLVAAGFAPMYAERNWSDAAQAPARTALQALLAAHDPWPALAVDRHWHLVAHNRMVGLLLAGLPERFRVPPVNVLRVSLDPEGLGGLIDDLPAWRAHVLQRLQRQAAASGDPFLAALHAELKAGGPAAEEHGLDAVAPTLVLRPQPGRPGLLDALGPLAFITTVTVFGAPHDVLSSELAIETLLPADAGTAQALRAAFAAAS